MKMTIRAAIIGIGLALVPSQGLAQSLDHAALEADLNAWLDWTRRTHPDLAHTTDLDALERAYQEQLDALPEQANRREAWLALAGINPLFDDAHTGIGPAAPEGASFAPVAIRDGRLVVAESIHPASALQPGDEITHINGADMPAMIRALMPTIRGESDRLRARILALRFEAFLDLWLEGEAPSDLTIQREGRALTITFDQQRDRAVDTDGAYALRIEDETAYLDVPSFDRARETAFLAFLEDAFAEIATSGARELVIDIRENGGGARQLSDPLLAYLTAERYTPTAQVTARIVAENIARIPGAQLGDVITLPFPQWVEPPAALPHRFDGDVTVLIGPDTYSQAIVFGAIVQDFQIGRLEGTPTEGAANQTGQVQRFTLPHTGFVARAPLYVFYRASGDTSGAPLTPDAP